MCRFISIAKSHWRRTIEVRGGLAKANGILSVGNTNGLSQSVSLHDDICYTIHIYIGVSIYLYNYTIDR